MTPETGQGTELGTALMLPGATPNALDLPMALVFDDWRRTGHAISRVGKAVPWWIGDWANFGECRYGETYAQVISELGLDYQTVSNYAWIARTYPVASRHEALSWRHHFDAAGLEEGERKVLLARAMSEGLTTREVRQEANRIKRELTGTGEVTVNATNVANTTALCDILDEVVAQIPEFEQTDDWINLRWRLALGMAEHGVIACEALTGHDIHALVSVPGSQEFRQLLLAIAKQGPV